MKKSILILAAILAAISALAQEKQIPKAETTLGDLIEMLRAEGYDSYSFDLSSLLDNEYKISAIAKEYTDGQLINEETLFVGSNKGFVKQADRLQLAFLPTNEAEKTRRFLFSLNNIGSIIKTFNLKSVSGGGKELCQYEVRPFASIPLKENEFHPLLLLGSWWYDEYFKVFRCCGENEIAPDLSSDILKDTPHYYVIGIKVQKIN